MEYSLIWICLLQLDLFYGRIKRKFIFVSKVGISANYYKMVRYSIN